MSNGWPVKDLISLSSATLTASMSSVFVGKSFPISAGGATRGLVVGLKLSGVAGTVTFQLQHAVNSDFSNVTGKTAVGANGWVYIKLLANVTADAALMPLLGVGRVVVTTDGSGAGTIEQMVVLQEQ